MKRAGWNSVVPTSMERLPRASVRSLESDGDTARKPMATSLGPSKPLERKPSRSRSTPYNMVSASGPAGCAHCRQAAVTLGHGVDVMASLSMLTVDMAYRNDTL